MHEFCIKLSFSCYIEFNSMLFWLCNTQANYYILAFCRNTLLERGGLLMTNNKTKIIVISTAFLLGVTSLSANSTEVEASTAKTLSTSSYKTTDLNHFRTVLNSKTVYIYSKPSATSKKLQKLPKNSAVIITNKQSGDFTKIRYVFGYAFIKTASLKTATVNTGSPYARTINKVYRYDIPYNKNSTFKNNFTATYTNRYASNKSIQNFWHYSSSPDQKGVEEYETNKGLYVGDIEDGYLSLEVKYPVKKNATWTGAAGKKSTIISTTATVKTKAGTFNKVVIVKNNNDYSYYAPNKGLILLKNKDKKTVFKLIK